MLGVATILLAIFVSLLITRIATVALTATGLSYDIARFQARSALSGVGFTTGEAEHIVEHPVRRRIILTLMLLGNAGLVTIVATTMLSFITQPRYRRRAYASPHPRWWPGAHLVAGAK